MNRNMRYRPNSGSASLGTYRNLEQRETLQQRSGKLQQKMVSNIKPFNRKRQYGNEQSSQNYVTYETNQGGTQSFAYLYDDGPGPSYDRGHVPNKKRQKINVWDIDVFGTNQNAGNQRNTPYTVRQNSPPRPLMSIPGPPSKLRRISNAPPKTHKNFTPNKVTKPFKPKPPAQPIKSPAQPADKEQYILRADKVPCQQMVGRLELALGSILKEMKANLCTNAETYSLFTSKVIQRSIKQTIRERIKTVMLNKHVGKYVDIIEAYRKRFPQNTDKDVLDMAVIKTGASEQHIKQSFEKILISKVNIMFKKLLVLVEDKEMEVAKLIEARQLFKDDKKTDEEIKQSVKIESDFYSSVVDSLLAARLPKILPNYALCIVKMLKREGHLKHTNEDDADHDDSGPIELPDRETEDDVVEAKQDAGEEVNTETIAKIETNGSIQDQEMTETNDEETTNDVSEEQNENNKEGDKIEKVTIKVEPATDAKAIENNESNIKPNGDTAELEKISKDIKSPATQTFLVKVLCQPELPSKAEAYKFLNKFNMTSVKKHKVIQNLLVVGFGTEKDYNDVLAASGTVIENSTLTIKGNKPQQTNAPSVPRTTNSEKEIKEEASSKENQLLTPDLENQITDLLSSIREQKENSDANDSIEKENEMANQDENPEGNTNMFSTSNPYDGQNELDTTKPIEESKEDEVKPETEPETTEVVSKTGADDIAAEDVKTTADDVDKTPADDVVKIPAEDVDKTPADIDKTPADVDKTPADVDKKPADVDKTPADVDKTPADVDKTPADVDKTPADVDKIPAEDAKPAEGIDKPAENADTVTKINKEAKGTPVRSSIRLAATPSSVRTRRASRLAQYN